MFDKVKPEEVCSLQRVYHRSLVAPQDAYWQEGLIGGGDHYLIQHDQNCWGYFVVNGENQLLQFFLRDPYQKKGSEVFRHLLATQAISSAYVATIEPFYLGLCLDAQVKTEVHTYLFSDHCSVKPKLEGFDGFRFRQATRDDLGKAVALFSGGDEFIDIDTIESQFGDQVGYAKMVIDAGILHILEQDGELIGTGELRVRKEWPPYADVGMIVAKRFRRRGVGTYILTLLKQLAAKQNLKTICSCEAGNLGSKKAVERAGFLANHRVLQCFF